MNEKLLLNSIIGDLCGSIYDNNPIKYEPTSLLSDSCYFTDTTVHTIAVANAILDNPENPDFSKFIRLWSKKYPNIKYGRLMTKWINDENCTINSFGSGAAMRVSPCSLLGLTDDYEYFNKRNILEVIKKSAEVTHNHPEGIKGAEVIGLCIHTSVSSRCIHGCPIGWYDNPGNIGSRLLRILQKFYPGYLPDHDSFKDKFKTRESFINYLRNNNKFSYLSKDIVPTAIFCSIAVKGYEKSIKLAISMGMRSSTLASIVGSIKGTYEDVPDYLIELAYEKLPKEMVDIIEEFDKYIEKVNGRKIAPKFLDRYPGDRSKYYEK